MITATPNELLDIDTATPDELIRYIDAQLLTLNTNGILSVAVMRDGALARIYSNIFI